LKTWSDEWDRTAKEVPVLRMAWHEGNERRFGLKERLAHLNSLWSGQLPGYTLIAESTDAKSPTRSSKPLRDTDIHPIRALRWDERGVVTAELDGSIPSTELHEHARRHQTRSPGGPLPLNNALRSVLQAFLEKENGTFPKRTKDFKDREQRFALVQVRTEQSAFRLAVFRAYRGRCPISDCEVPEALEAAHFRGRDWREGDNAAHDGILLRRDLHALYDSGLLEMASDRTIHIAPEALRDYEEFDGLVIAPPALT
jgi:hypothetical protein